MFTQEFIHYGLDSFITIAENQGGFNAELDAGDRFSRDHDKIGDVNGDGFINIVDIVLIVNLVLANEYNFSPDYNSDETLDILDIVQMVNSILEE